MKKVISILLISLMLVFTGCSTIKDDSDRETKTSKTEAEVETTTYRYVYPCIAEPLIITKSEYSDGVLRIYHDGTLDDSYRIYCDYDIDYEINDECATIYYHTIEDITALTFTTDWYKFDIRYLDSDQYAVLAYIFAMDYGWDIYAGSETDYYTAQELEDMEQRRAERQNEFLRCWDIVEGRYNASNGDYIEFYVLNENDYLVSQNGYTYRVLYITETDNHYEISCSDDPYDYSFEFDMDENGNIAIHDFQRDEDIIYER